MPSLLYVQLSQPYITIWKKPIAQTRWTFVDKVISLPFNMLSRFVVAFLPRRKHFLISWLQSPSAVILESKKIKSVTVSTVSPSICYEVMGLDAMIFTDWMLSFQSAFSLSSFPFINRLFSSSLHQPLWSSDMSCEPWGTQEGEYPPSCSHQTAATFHVKPWGTQGMQTGYWPPESWDA